MPTYTYLCPPCNREYDINKAITQATRTEVCPKCMSPLKRVYDSPPALRIHMGTPRFHK